MMIVFDTNILTHGTLPPTAKYAKITKGEFYYETDTTTVKFKISDTDFAITNPYLIENADTKIMLPLPLDEYALQAVPYHLSDEGYYFEIDDCGAAIQNDNTCDMYPLYDYEA